MFGDCLYGCGIEVELFGGVSRVFVVCMGWGGGGGRWDGVGVGGGRRGGFLNLGRIGEVKLVYGWY